LAYPFQEFVLMFLWYGMGFTLYLTKFPERFFPNRYVLVTYVFESWLPVGCWWWLSRAITFTFVTVPFNTCYLTLR
jgi:hypothetical protein